ncbi:MAG: nucleotide exchange factor GrpE [Gemmatimonadota bacterium]|jgi:molecular chaperone GrpE|nr:nucleotide exchange factor GrpE [Gemmatimonadota bacterium]
MRLENDGGDEAASPETFVFENARAGEVDLPGDLPEGDENSPASEELEALRERYLRLAAEFENFRKRTERERVEWRDRAQGQLVTRFLDVVDDLDRLGMITPDGTPSDTLVEGVRMIDRKFKSALEAAGLEPVPAEGQRFDPASHEAIMMTPTEDPAEDEMVGHVLQTGYRFKGTLLRPARVQVKRLDG